MLDFIRLCKEQNIQYLESGHHHSHEGWAQINCPFCTDGTHGWHLGYSLERGNMNCWRCGSHSIYDYFKIVLPNKSVKQILNQYNDATFLPEKKMMKPRTKKAKRPPGLTSLYPVHEKYLKDNKFKKGIIKEWDLQATSGTSGEWCWRIIAPISDRAGVVTGYAGRALQKEIRPRWKFTRNEEMSADPKRMLYGIDRVQDRVLIVEGVSDVWRMGAGAVAVFGIDWNVEQAFILKDFSHRFILFDPEREAQKRARELAEWMAVFPGETEIISGFETDPGEMSQNQADEIKKELGI